MKTIFDIIVNEFTAGDYTLLENVSGMPLFCSNDGKDYWIIANDPNILESQKSLFKQLTEKSTQYIHIEKNLSLLLLQDVSVQGDRFEAIKVEKDKSYFKKYLLNYSTDEVYDLVSIMDSRHATTIADLLMETEYFSFLKKNPNVQSGVHLLYTLAHKLPFIPVNTIVKDRKEVNFHFSSPDMFSLLEWVNKAPSREFDIDKYISKTLGPNE